MDPGYWHERWQDNRTAFHQDKPTPLLLGHWPALQLPPDSRVFVPLAGKSLDMAWFAAQGHRVLGVELSTLAIEQFFAGQGLTPEIHDSPLGRHYRTDRIELIRGDAFALDTHTLAGCNAVYDRAALIALPPPMRQRYAIELYARLPTGCQGLLITLEYPPHEKSGPPFPVDQAEVHALFAGQWRVDRLERRDILAGQPGFAAEGVTSLHTSAYRLQRI